MKGNGSNGNGPNKGFLNPINEFAFFIFYQILMYLGMVHHYTFNAFNNLGMAVNNNHEEESDATSSNEDEREEENEKESDTDSSHEDEHEEQDKKENDAVLDHEGDIFGDPVDNALDEEKGEDLKEKNTEEAVTPFPSQENSMLNEEDNTVLDHEEDDESTTVPGSEGAVADEEGSITDSNEDEAPEADKNQHIEQEIKHTEVDDVTSSVVEQLLLLGNGDNTPALFSGDTNLYC